MDAPFCWASGWRSAYHQFDTPLAQGWHYGGWPDPWKWGGNTTGRFNQCFAEQYLPVLCAWSVVKLRLNGEAYMVRYIDGFVLCFQYRSDALRLQDVLCKRLGKFGTGFSARASLRSLPCLTKLYRREFCSHHKSCGLAGGSIFPACKPRTTIVLLDILLHAALHQAPN